MNNDLTNSFLYSDEWNSFLKSYRLMMEEYKKTLFLMNTRLDPILRSIKESMSTLAPIYIEFLKQYSTQISRIIDSSNIREIINYNSKMPSLSIREALREYNWSTMFKNYSSIINYIDFNQINIKEDGTVIYQNEEIKISNKDVDNAIETLNSIKEDTSTIRSALTNKKSIIVVIIIFIVSGICNGFFNKCGESIYDLVANAYNNHIEENENNTKDSFIMNYRIVNANTLTVREEDSSKSKVLGKLYLNQFVQVLEKTNYWTKVKYVNKEKGISLVGWVYTRYLSYIDEEISNLIEK